MGGVRGPATCRAVDQPRAASARSIVGERTKSARIQAGFRQAGATEPERAPPVADVRSPVRLPESSRQRYGCTLFPDRPGIEGGQPMKSARRIAKPSAKKVQPAAR